MDQDNSNALIDSGSEVNAIYPAYAAKFGLSGRKTDVGAKKSNGSHPKPPTFLPQKPFVVPRNLAEILNEDAKIRMETKSH